MKLGIFGDSYADCHTYETGWPNLLAKEISKQDDFKNYGVSGTSHWFSYQNFLENFHNYDTIVFCHTNSMRWPVTPPGEHRKAFNIGYFSCPIMDPFNKVRKDILSEDLLQFISQSIFWNVNRLCAENKKYLINIFCFTSDFELPKTNFPILSNLDQISRKEQVLYGLKLRYVSDLNKILSRGDRRDCHLNPSNNKKLANILKELIYNKTTNFCVDLLTGYEWDYRDPILDKTYKWEYEYEKNLNNR